jgi:hypothetical protein
MTTFMVGYDLGKPAANYSGLIEHLKSYGTYWHNLDSTWFIVTSNTAAEVRDGAAKFLDSSDKLVVVTVGRPGAWQGITADASDWLLAQLI